MIVSIEEAIEDIKKGKIIILVDDEDRENEGDFVFAADFATPEAVNFLATYGRGLICVPATQQRMIELDLEAMVNRNTALLGTPFTISVDAVRGTTTGISAQDRAITIKAFVEKNTKPSDLARPGHIFPLEAKNGGVLERAGHTEAVVDLARLAGLKPCGVLCEILSEDGSMARMPELKKIAKKHKLKIATIRDLIEFRLRTEILVKPIVKTKIPNQYGVWDLIMYEDIINKEHHLAMVMGNIKKKESVLTRVHSQCFTGDVLGSLRCDCGPQMHKAMELIEKEGCGVFVYMHQEGRGIGLVNKLHAYVLQDQGKDTVEANEALGFKADLRDYGLGAQILCDLGLKKIRLMTNNPRKIIGLEAYNLKVVERVPIIVGKNEYNDFYLKTKEEKMGHFLTEHKKDKKKKSD